MQEQSRTFLDFSARTDALAARLGCDVQDLPDKLGFSRSSLFAYRTGKSRISDKAWAKLREAEEGAGLAVSSDRLPKAPTLQDDSAPYFPRPPTPTETAVMIGRIEKRLDDLTDLVQEIARAMNLRNGVGRGRSKED